MKLFWCIVLYGLRILHGISSSVMSIRTKFSIISLILLLDPRVDSTPIVNGKPAGDRMFEWKTFLRLNFGRNSRKNTNTRISLNVIFIPGKFPFAVVFAIYEKGSGKFKPFCGGTLVDETTSQSSLNSHFSWCLSAAHCFLDSNM